MVTPRQVGVTLVIMCRGVGDRGFQKGNLTQIYWSVSILFRFLNFTVRSKDLAPITKELGEIEAMFIFSGSRLTIIVSVKYAFGVSSAIVKNVLILGMGVVVEGFWKFPILNTAFFMLGVVTFSFIMTRDL